MKTRDRWGMLLALWIVAAIVIFAAFAMAPPVP